MGSIRTVVVAPVVDLALVDTVPEMLEIVKVVIYPRLLLVGGLASGKAIRLSGVPVESARRESKAFHVRDSATIGLGVRTDTLVSTLVDTRRDEGKRLDTSRTCRALRHKGPSSVSTPVDIVSDVPLFRLVSLMASTA